MAQDLREHAFLLPHATSYDALAIPFVYPPLGLYLVALLTPLLPAAELLRWIPLLFSVVSVVAFGWLAHALLRREEAIAATFAYALLPASFAWSVMGGGVTRAPGLVFALLALVAWQRALRGGRAVLAAGTLAGLAVLTHPDAAQFVAVSGVVLLARIVLDRARARRAAQVLAVAALVSAPWWIAVTVAHGPAPFAAALANGAGLSRLLATLLAWNAWNEPLFPIVAAAALAGVLVTVARRERYLSVWLVLVAALTPHAFQAFSAIPLALLAGVGVVGVGRAAGDVRVARLAAAAAITYAAVAAVFASTVELVGLSAAEVDAMRWVDRNTPPGTRFLIVSGQPEAFDRTAEWFPALAGRPSVDTVQGTEWLDPAVYRERQRRSAAARACAASDTSCVALRTALRDDPRYELLYESAGAVIYRRR